MPNFTSLRQMREEVRNLADMNNSEFVSNSEIDGYLQRSWEELYDIIIQKYEEDYFLKSSNITTVSSTDSYDLPVDFYKLRGVDLQINTTTWQQLQRYRFTQRSRDNVFNVAENFNYRLQGSKVYFTPTPSGSNTVRLWYIPNPRMIETTSPTGISRASTTTWTTDPKNFAVGDQVRLYDFSAVTGDYNTVQEVTAVGATTITTDFNSSSPTTDPTVYGELCSMIDSYSGWDQYVIMDTVIKCLQKEESDTKRFMEQKLMLMQRIKASANQRDAGEPMTVTNVSDYNSLYYY